MKESDSPPRQAESRISESIRYVWELFANPQRNAVALLLIGVAFHLGLWALSGGYLNPKLGDDEGGYIVLALEAMGLMDEPGWRKAVAPFTAPSISAEK